MLTINSFQLHAMLAAFFWPFARMLAFLSSDPIFGSRGIPVRVRVGLAFVLTVLLMPMLSVPSQISPGSALGLVILAEQILIGIAMGLTMRLIFAALDVAGNLIGLQMGLGFATFYDPQHATQTAVVSQLFYLLAVLLFFAMNGHLQVIDVLVTSFRELPITAQPLPAMALHSLVQWGGNIFSWGVRLSLPVMATLLMVNLALGIISKAAPQLNLFAIGFPVTLAVGFVMLLFLLPYYVPLFADLFREGFHLALSLAKPR